MVLGQPRPGAGMVAITGTSPGREYGIKGSFDRAGLDERLADTRSRVDAMLTNTNSMSLEERLEAGRADTKGRLQDLNEMYDSPMELEAQRDALNPRFDPYDEERRTRQMADYQSMLQSNRDAYDARDIKPEKPSLSQLGAQFGLTTKFGYKPYEQARLNGYEDSEILSYLQANPSTQSPDFFQELLSGNVNTDNITSDKNRGNPLFRSIIGM
tara:strand:- start:5270 stop:5908 length:639 start_codon:yes stop_codon:yes gene_type:complete